MDLATVDKLLTTTRSVRARLDLTRPVPAELIEEYFRLFVNRSAYTVQSARPHPRGGKHYYYRPKEQDRTCVLASKVNEQHLLGKVTVGL